MILQGIRYCENPQVFSTWEKRGTLAKQIAMRSLSSSPRPATSSGSPRESEDFAIDGHAIVSKAIALVQMKVPLHILLWLLCSQDNQREWKNFLLQQLK